MKLFCTIYKVYWDKSVKIDKNEVEKIEFWSESDILSKKVDITPYSLESFKFMVGKK